MTSPLTAENVRFGHTDEESALVVDDYPYGRQIRTQIRYWLETTKNGDRFVSQTLNPKTGRWNKPKKSTYCEVGVIFIEPDTGYVRWTGLHLHATDEGIERFRAATEGKLSDAQKAKLARILGMKKVFEKVTFTVESNVQRTAEEQAEKDAEQVEINRRINRAIAVETHRAARDLD